MFAGIVQQALGGALLRVRMEARKAAFAGAAGALLMGALSLAGAAGIVVLSARYGVVVGLLAGAALLAVLAVATFLIGRRVPGAAATRAEVQAEAVAEDVPAPGIAHPEAVPNAAASLSNLHRTVRGHAEALMPPGDRGALAGLAARQLAAKPVPTLAAAAMIGAAIGLLRMSGAGARAVPEDEAPPAPPDDRPAQRRSPDAGPPPLRRRPRAAHARRRASGL